MPQKKVRSQNGSGASTMTSYFVSTSTSFAVQAPHNRTLAETIEARLERKAQAADRDNLPAQSLGQLDRTARHKRLYGG